MRFRRRAAIVVAAFVLLAVFVLLGRWYGPQRASPALSSTSSTVEVVDGSDHGAGTLREALFAADAAAGRANVLIRVEHITLESALPPIVNPHGIQITGPAAGVAIDAHALGASEAVFDIDAENAALSGVSIQHSPGAAILVRARRFHLTESHIEACDVGVEVAANASEVALERNYFDGNRIGVRFSASSRNSEVAKNEFSGSTEASLWLVASQPSGPADAISLHDNRFDADRTAVVLGNIPVVLEHNDFTAVREAAVHVIGTGAVVRNNRIASGAAAGIVVENARGALLEGNELSHLDGYAMLLRGAADALIRDNRIQSCGYGMGFVLGDAHQPSTAVGNTLIDLKYDGIDVLGDSPILRRNQVLQARVTALHVEDFTAPGAAITHARPLLDNNSFQGASASVVSQAPSPH
jgi:Right handed beta helix region